MSSTPTTPIYSMHKYWGKKPSAELQKILEKYSKEGDTVFDPFSGYGGIAIESLFLNRNVVANDLNPVAAFISKTILNEHVNVQKVEQLFLDIQKQYKKFESEWYEYHGAKILTILRNKDDVPKKVKIKNGKEVQEIILSENEIDDFIQHENKHIITTWYPTDTLITNSIISAKEGMRICELFSKRALICQSYLYSLIDKLGKSPEKDLLLLAFTANLANCSKLVPPITSRGDMAQGAWMTGFYVGETYLENNVFHYFENRVKKAINGKQTYLKKRVEEKVTTTYSIFNEDAKKTSLNSNSVDFVFTDFPYGDTVPYFEQSQLWNSWLRFNVNYDNEIVISDSPQRNKGSDSFGIDIRAAIKEIKRVLKFGGYFVFTFHSLCGKEWEAIHNALASCNFEFVDCDIMLQKTLPPRQLNRSKTIKGDIVVTYRNSSQSNPCFVDFYETIEDDLRNRNGEFDTNDIIVIFVKAMLRTSYTKNIDFSELAEQYFLFDEKLKKWSILITPLI